MVWAITTALLIGILVGLLLSRIIFRPRSIGSLRVDRSDDDPYLFLELNKPLNASILRQRFVTFEVCAKNYISHK